MTAKEYLSQVSILNQRIANMQHQIDDLRTRLTDTGGIDYGRDRVKSSLPSDPLADRVAKIVDLEARLNKQIDRYIDKRQLITEQINGLEDARYIRILGMRYLQDLPLHLVAEEMHYEYKWCCKLHGQALTAFAEKYLLEK